jgi:preprotein translocase subunit SecD
LLDASQLSDVRFYPYGYHWLVAPDFQPSDVAAAQLVPDQRGGVAVLITFTDHGAAVFRRIAIAAAENVGAMNQIALFSGSEIFSAPQVLRAPDGPQTEVSGPFTLEQAAQIAVDIAPG